MFQAPYHSSAVCAVAFSVLFPVVGSGHRAVLSDKEVQLYC